MAEDWTSDPEARAWADRVLTELLPKLRDSAVNLSLVPDQAGLGDVKFAVELGLSIMLDKPIILAVVPGRELPDHLVRVADDIIEWDDTDPDLGKRIGEAVEKVTGP